MFLNKMQEINPNLDFILIRVTLKIKIIVVINHLCLRIIKKLISIAL